LQQFNIDIDHVTTGSAPGRPLIDYLEEVENTHNAVREILSDQDVLEIEYESDIDTKGAEYAYHKVCNFLKLHPTEVEVKNKRVNPFPLKDSIQNYDEIILKLEGTAFEWMLEI
jgi:hypothetical protein